MLTTTIVVGGIGLIVILARIFWRQVKKLWAKAKQGGVILSQPRRYILARLPPVLPQLDLRPDRHGDLPRRVRAARDVRVGDVGDGLGLAGERGVIHSRRGRRDAGDERARAQDLLRCRKEHRRWTTRPRSNCIVTAWNQVVAIVLVVVVFGWVGGKQLVSESYVQAKEKSAEMRAERKRKREEKKRGR